MRKSKRKKRERGKEGKRERGKEGKRERGKEGKRERGKKREGKPTAASATVNTIQNLSQQMISGDLFEFVGEKFHKVLIIEGENECKDQSRSSKPK